MGAESLEELQKAFKQAVTNFPSYQRFGESVNGAKHFVSKSVTSTRTESYEAPIDDEVEFATDLLLLVCDIRRREALSDVYAVIACLKQTFRNSTHSGDADNLQALACRLNLDDVCSFTKNDENALADPGQGMDIIVSAAVLMWLRMRHSNRKCMSGIGKKETGVSSLCPSTRGKHRMRKLLESKFDLDTAGANAIGHDAVLSALAFEQAKFHLDWHYQHPSFTGHQKKADAESQARFFTGLLEAHVVAVNDTMYAQLPHGICEKNGEHWVSTILNGTPESSPDDPVVETLLTCVPGELFTWPFGVDANPEHGTLNDEHDCIVASSHDRNSSQRHILRRRCQQISQVFQATNVCNAEKKFWGYIGGCFETCVDPSDSWEYLLLKAATHLIVNRDNTSTLSSGNWCSTADASSGVIKAIQERLRFWESAEQRQDSDACLISIMKILSSFVESDERSKLDLLVALLGTLMTENTSAGAFAFADKIVEIVADGNCAFRSSVRLAFIEVALTLLVIEVGAEAVGSIEAKETAATPLDIYATQYCEVLCRLSDDEGGRVILDVAASHNSLLMNALRLSSSSCRKRLATCLVMALLMRNSAAVMLESAADFSPVQNVLHTLAGFPGDEGAEVLRAVVSDLLDETVDLIAVLGSCEMTHERVMGQHVKLTNAILLCIDLYSADEYVPGGCDPGDTCTSFWATHLESLSVLRRHCDPIADCLRTQVLAPQGKKVQRGCELLSHVVVLALGAMVIELLYFERLIDAASTSCGKSAGESLTSHQKSLLWGSSSRLDTTPSSPIRSTVRPVIIWDSESTEGFLKIPRQSADSPMKPPQAVAQILRRKVYRQLLLPWLSKLQDSQRLTNDCCWIVDDHGQRTPCDFLLSDLKHLTHSDYRECDPDQPSGSTLGALSKIFETNGECVLGSCREGVWVTSLAPLQLYDILLRVPSTLSFLKRMGMSLCRPTVYGQAEGSRLVTVFKAWMERKYGDTTSDCHFPFHQKCGSDSTLENSLGDHIRRVLEHIHQNTLLSAWRASPTSSRRDVENLRLLREGLTRVFSQHVQFLYQRLKRILDLAEDTEAAKSAILMQQLIKNYLTDIEL